MFDVRTEEALVNIMEAQSNDKMSMVLNEAVETMKSHEKIDPLNNAGIQEIISDQVLFNRYLGKICEGMGSSAANKENFRQIVNNSFKLMVNESTISSIAPISTLLMPMLRRAWPKIGIKEAIPTHVAKVPQFKVVTMKPWIKDGTSKQEIPGDYTKLSFKAARDRFKKTTIKQVGLIKDGGLVKNGPSTDSKFYAPDRIHNPTGTDAAGHSGNLLVNGTEQTLTVSGYTHDQASGYTLNSDIGVLGVEIDYLDSAEITDQAGRRARDDGAGTGGAITSGTHTIRVPLNFEGEIYSAVTGEKGKMLKVSVTGTTFAGDTDTRIYNNPRHRFHPETGFIHINLKLTKEELDADATGSADVSATGGFFGVFERGAWKFVGQSLNTGSPTATTLVVKQIYLDATIETTQNKKATQSGFDMESRDISIPTGEHIETSLGMEYLHDLMAQYGIDGTLQATTIISDFIVNKVDIEGFEFLENYYNNFKADMQNVTTSTTNNTQDAFIDRTFDVFPPARYNSNNDDWIRHELKRIIDNLGSTLKNITLFNEGEFVIVGNPANMNLLTHATWHYVDGSEGEDGVVINHSLGTLQSGTNRYKLFASQNIEYDSTDANGDVNAMWIFFVPSNPQHCTVKYFPYTFNVLKTSEGFASPNNANVPAIMMTKRHKFEEFYRMVGKIKIKNNTGATGTMS